MPPPTVLIIDDHAAVRGLLVAVCAGAGFRALTADTCVAGAATLRENPVDLVVLDMAMPDLGGVDALNAIQQVQPNVPILVTTDRGIDRMVKDLLSAGAAMCLEKPFDIDFVERAFRNSLRKS